MSVTEILGDPFNRDLYIMPLVHPASILRGQWAKEPAQIAYLRRFSEAMRSGELDNLVTDIEQPAPHTVLYPSPEQTEQLTLRAVELVADERNVVLVVDLENAGPHIICFGIGLFDMDTCTFIEIQVVRVRRQGGRQWHARDELVLVLRALFVLFACEGLPKVFHNGVTHDVPLLIRAGFEVKGRLLDTLVLAHAAYSEFPKSLQWCSTLYLGAPVWKRLVEDEEDEKG